MPTPRTQTNTAQRFYITFSFGIRHTVGVDLLPMWQGWVEIVARGRGEALMRANQRFGYAGWQLHTKEAFTTDRRKFYPDGCKLVLWEG